MKKYNRSKKWKWSQFSANDIERIKPLLLQDGREWLKKVRDNRSNYLRVKAPENGEKVVYGSLIYQQSFEDDQDYKIFHFYVTEDHWITVDLALPAFKHINLEFLVRQINRTEHAVDGFLIFLGELMNEMLVEIDQFEVELKTLIWSIRDRNETGILEKVYRRRHELLVWKSLLIPIRELKMGIEEADFEEVSKGEIFTRTCRRIERAVVLLNEYEHEIDSIINLEEVISSHRGNEIMKTLTVITIIFTPIMAYGALWGMNFKYMPELGWRHGYLFALILVIFTTLLLYGYLKVKGWTGDLLKGKKRGSFFK
ncbi:magnesium transporter CorA family protein [Paenibacillus sp. BSR1-1]|uniref:magnesium transporter CorA family protein n=1 Tax=Paenibacillus sp. BSR1-1 TaxID=3020845 RepID=UPI0025AED018|nr:magnesium transporter CorA family protein [Paenibacillus sp. BSR1-1]MDN3018042.1 magnesium transporter CorA family protein [Paenibacillus sp. BSR1-1]